MRSAPHSSSSFWKDPIRPDEMARESVGDMFQVVLVFRLGLPECAYGNHFGHNLPGHNPEALTSAIVSSAIGFCSSFVKKIAKR